VLNMVVTQVRCLIRRLIMHWRPSPHPFCFASHASDRATPPRCRLTGRNTANSTVEHLHSHQSCWCLPIARPAGASPTFVVHFPSLEPEHCLVVAAQMIVAIACCSIYTSSGVSLAMVAPSGSEERLIQEAPSNVAVHGAQSLMIRFEVNSQFHNLVFSHPLCFSSTVLARPR
jgi:hypothetical protein